MDCLIIWSILRKIVGLLHISNGSHDDCLLMCGQEGARSYLYRKLIFLIYCDDIQRFSLTRFFDSIQLVYNLDYSLTLVLSRICSLFSLYLYFSGWVTNSTMKWWNHFLVGRHLICSTQFSRTSNHYLDGTMLKNRFVFLFISHSLSNVFWF